jgi:hypothetical protein
MTYVLCYLVLSVLGTLGWCVFMRGANRYDE